MFLVSTLAIGIAILISSGAEWVEVSQKTEENVYDSIQSIEKLLQSSDLKVPCNLFSYGSYLSP
jgi:hypothetical protein